jgi:hypothetical protein
MAKMFHDAIPEELLIKEVLVTKGLAQKKMRIMGRGRTGVGYTRKSHVTVKVEKINFDERIDTCRNSYFKNVWTRRKELVERIKKNNSAV